MRPLVALALLSLASLGSPQTVADALRGNAKPILTADLPDGYRAVSLSMGEGMGGLSPYLLMGVGMGNSSDQDPRSKILFGLMGTTFVDPDEFAALLDGKRPRIRAYVLDLGAVMGSASRNTKVPTPVFAETWIEAGRILQWSPRPAMTKAAILEAFGRSDVPGDSPSDKSVGLSNVKQVALGIMLYCSDADDVFPFANSSAEAKRAVMPYTKSEDVWNSPAGGRILYNTALSGVSATSIVAPAETLLVWEETTYPDGKRAVGYTDGHAMRRDESEWAEAWRAELRRRAKAKADAVHKAGAPGASRTKVKVRSQAAASPGR